MFHLSQISIVKKQIFSLIILSITIYSQSLSAQSVYAPLNEDYYHLLERYEIKTGRLLPNLHSHIKPIKRSTIAGLADSTWANLPGLSAQDQFNLAYLRRDNWEWSQEANNESKKPFLRHFYRNQSNLYHHQEEDFMVQVNPVFHASVSSESDNSETPFINTRGIEVRGLISQKVGFYTYMTDTQALFPRYVTNKITEFDAVPGEGFYKRNPGDDQVDFLTARGYITFAPVKNIDLQFGYDRLKLGNGYRSLILSDFASNYLFLRLNTNVWKLNYQNVFAQLTAEKLNSDGLYPRKFFAMHHLSMNIGKNVNIGLFEAIMFNRHDTLSNQNGSFDFKYLNPIIFYRSMEQQAGSPDNAVLGMDIKWHFAKHFALYGQLLIDEFILSEIRNGTGWRGNKQAGQIGMKYIDAFGLSNLDLQAELNLARPYTFSHNFLYGEFSHYNQPLVHPLGANFYEWVGVLRYQPFPRLQFTGRGVLAKYGTDQANENNGANIFLDNTQNSQEYGNSIGQGVDTQLLFLDATLSYQVRHNVFFDLKHIYRNLNSSLDERDLSSHFTSVAFRWNIPQRDYTF